MTPAAQRPSLADILPEWAGEYGDLIPVNLTLDSRQAGPGDVFIALPGQLGDGRSYIEQAVSQGVSAVLAEADGFAGRSGAGVITVPGLRKLLPRLAGDFYGNPSQSMTLVAVTGTNGKTSVSDFIAQLLRQLGVATGSLGTLGARIDQQPSAIDNTTPDILTINRQLAEWQEQGITCVALEASSHALDQGRLDGLCLHTGVFTNLTRDHLDYHADEAAYARAKLSLFENFSLQQAVCNDDDPVARRVRELVDCPVFGVSTRDRSSEVFVEVVTTSPLRVRLHTPFGSGLVEVDLSGSFNAVNLAMAVVVVAGLGHPFDSVLAAATRLQAVVGRMQTVPNDRGLRVVVDYAHTPDALAGALSALRTDTSGRLWVVFGCGGDRDRGKRAMMGSEASRYADRLVITSDNPRGELPDAIIADICEGVTGDRECVPDRREAIRFALFNAEPGDTVLVAGKGHETYQEIQGERLPFSDAEVATQWFREAADA